MNVKRISLVFLVLFFSLGLVVKPAQASSCTQYHTVQRGEYLAKIAREYGVSWRWLAEINNLANPNRLFAGQKICVETTGAPDLVCTQSHTVKRGEWLAKIARLYGISWRWLAEINNLANPNRLLVGQVLCVELGEGSPTQPGVDPALTVLAVSRNESVKLRLVDFPAKERFNVYMYEYGDDPDNGLLIDNIKSGNGNKQVILEIPEEFHGISRLTVRMESPTSHYVAIVSFYNRKDGGSLDGGYQGYPTITILAVDPDETVTIRANNLPPNDEFDVLMNRMGTRGEDGILVGSFETGRGGTLEKTFRIPSALEGRNRIAIRIESPLSGYFAYNWFNNR